MTDLDSTWMILRTIGSLALIVSLLFGIAFLAKRYFRPERWGLKISGIQILQTMPIDTKRKLIVVEVEEQRLLLGVGQDSINTLAHLEKKSPSIEGSQPKKEVIYAQASS